MPAAGTAGLPSPLTSPPDEPSPQRPGRPNPAVAVGGFRGSMVIDSVESFLTVLRRVELLAPEQADEVARELGPHYADPQRLGEYLVEIDWLTAYQLRLLLTGRWDDLTVGPYHVLDRLGEGGESEVFKAWDTQRGRLVALKVLR